ncbi:hypothetical protein IFM89_009593 [Coptis chinensis]|uniref:Uncharacterized protein n=1 Tax=Coptis chinensis TaxID=261450 RepID=A0A835INL1_9MAGN|nr:hypothetical protein IFM89_009593 [Coptis chinensis]
MQDGTPWPGNNVRDHPGMIQASVRNFVEVMRAYRVIFPESEKEKQLVELAVALFTKHFETIQQHIKEKVSAGSLLEMLRSYLEIS